VVSCFRQAHQPCRYCRHPGPEYLSAGSVIGVETEAFQRSQLGGRGRAGRVALAGGIVLDRSHVVKVVGRSLKDRCNVSARWVMDLTRVYCFRLHLPLQVVTHFRSSLPSTLAIGFDCKWVVANENLLARGGRNPVKISARSLTGRHSSATMTARPQPTHGPKRPGGDRRRSVDLFRELRYERLGIESRWSSAKVPLLRIW
jgi:hypothetical protein